MTKSHLRSSVPCVQTSLYRSPIAGAKFTDLSLQITPYKEDGEKKFPVENSTFIPLFDFSTHKCYGLNPNKRNIMDSYLPLYLMLQSFW